MRLRDILPAILALAALLLPSCGKPPGKFPDRGTVRGVVKDGKTNAPVEGATVRVGDEIESSDGSGEYQISIEVGEYSITVKKDGFEEYRSISKVKVEKDTITNFEVSLEPMATVAPAVALEEKPAAVTRERNVQFSWKAGGDDPERALTFSWILEGLETASSPFSARGSVSYRDLKDGTYVFRIKARDEKSQVEGEALSWSFEVDTVPPQAGTLLPATEGTFVGTRAVALVLAAEGATEVALWEGEEPAALPWGPFRESKQVVLSAGDGEKLLFAKYRDGAGNETDAAICTLVLDTLAPVRPAGLKADASNPAEIRLTWDPTTDAGSGVEAYTVLRDGMEIGKVQTPTYVDRRAELGMKYAYAVTAMDRMKRVSEPSAQVLVEIRGRPPLAPSAPNPADKATGTPTQLTLSWQGADPDRGDTVKYDLYFGPDPAPPLRSSGLASPTFTPEVLQPSTSYHWRVVARDLQGLETPGRVWSFTTAARANSAPRALLTATPLSGPSGTDFRFDASGSQDAEDPPSALRFRWVFDGTGEGADWVAQSAVTKRLTGIGRHTVEVTVRDTLAAEHKAAVTVEVLNSAPSLEGQPMPLNGSTSEPVDVTLSWNFRDADPGDAVTYDVYFGRDQATLRLVARRTAENRYKPEEALEKGAVYYWRVDAYDSNDAVTKGPLWSFATARTAAKRPFQAELTASPPAGGTATTFRFDASGSTDPQDPPELLRVRWDFDGDGKPDTSWAESKQATHRYSAVGTVEAAVEVQNSRGEISKATLSVKVENTAPVFAGRTIPANGAGNVEPDAELRWTTSDPDPEDAVTYDLFLAPAGPGGPKAVATNLKASHWQPPEPLASGKAYNWKVVAKDRHGGSAETPILTFTVRKRVNRPPVKPPRPEGPVEVRFGDEAKVRAGTRDPDGDAIRLRFDWGDGNVSPWGLPDKEGWVAKAHRYALQGNYMITAQAQDIRGDVSPWSDPHPISILPERKPGDVEDLYHWDPQVLAKLPDLYTFKLRYWFANLSGSGEWQAVGDPTGDITFNPDLGIAERKGAPWFQAEIGRYIAGGLEYFVLEYTGSATFSEDSLFGEQTFTAGTDVDTTSTVRYGSLYAQFSPYLGDYVGGGFRLGMGYFWNRTTVTPKAGGPTEVETIGLPFPVLGVKLYGQITKFFRVNVEFAAMEGSLQEADLRSGRVLDLAVDLSFTPVHFMGLAIGYRYTNVWARLREGGSFPETELDLRLDGVTLSFVTHF